VGLAAGPINLAILDRHISHVLVRVPCGNWSAQLGATSAPIGNGGSRNRLCERFHKQPGKALALSARVVCTELFLYGKGGEAPKKIAGAASPIKRNAKGMKNG